MGLHNVDKSIRTTQLWNILERKAEEEKLPPEFMAGVSKVCAYGITLEKDIIRFFPPSPSMTLYTSATCATGCINCWRVGGRNLTATDAALLVMSAACHDIGMSVSDEQKRR